MTTEPIPGESDAARRRGRPLLRPRMLSGGRHRRHRRAAGALVTMVLVGVSAVALVGLTRTLWGQTQPPIRYPGSPQATPGGGGMAPYGGGGYPPGGGMPTGGANGYGPGQGAGGGPGGGQAGWNGGGDAFTRVASLPMPPAESADGLVGIGPDGQPLTESPTSSPSLPGWDVLAVLADGGPLMLPIGGCSFVLMIFVFERMVSLRRSRVVPRPFVKRFFQRIREGDLDPEEAIKLCEANKSPVAEVFAAAVKKWDRSGVEVEQAILDEGERVTNKLRKYARLFHGISTLCPLLGLLGTVVGMIEAFRTIASSSAMGRPELLASGISQALLTTAAGLTVAIPALVAHLAFSGRVDKLTMEIDTLGQELVGLIASDGWERNQAAGSRRRRAA